jgi:undecaprenyl-diphosphatase
VAEARVTSRAGLVVAAGAVALFAYLLVTVWPAGHPVAFDLAISTWVAAHRFDEATWLARAISTIGSGLVIAPLSLLVAVYVHRRGGWREVRWLAAAMMVGPLLYIGLNELISRPRPPPGLRITEEVAWSFPSGHSTVAVLFWLSFAVLATVDRPRGRRVAIVGAVVFALATGASRIYLAAHWPTDVLGGLALGTAWLCVVLAVRGARGLAPLSDARADRGSR